MLWHLCIIALVGLVPSEKEGKISTDRHVAAQKSPVLRLREDSSLAILQDPRAPWALLQPFPATSTLIHQGCPLLLL